jgi:hypothetical protein
MNISIMGLGWILKFIGCALSSDQESIMMKGQDRNNQESVKLIITRKD